MSGTELLQQSEQIVAGREVRHLVTGEEPVVLSEATVRLLGAGIPINTRKAYGRDREEWIQYTADRGLPAVPVHPEVLADFASLLLVEGSPLVAEPRPLAASSVARRLAAISTYSLERGAGRPDLRAARLVLRGHRRTHPRRRRQAAPVTVHVLKALVAATHPDDPRKQPTLRNLRDRAIVLLGFALGARRSELVTINLGDLHEDPAGLRVDLLRAKTAEQTVEVAVPWASDPALCPVRAALGLRTAMNARGTTAGPLFCRITRSDALLPHRLSGETVADVVTRLATRAQVSVPDGFNGWTAHSLRRGFATEARRAGADPLSIARQGGWADNSAALADYLVDLDRWSRHPLNGVL